jgi:catechol 2,3-dioxygenase-like lactoylglutathione lyase family enzyme
MKIERIDHIVLTVADIDAACKFYHDTLGMQVETFGDGRKALKFGNQKLNLHQKGKEFEPKAKYPTPGAIDICFITNEPVEQVQTALENKNIQTDGLYERTGAIGRLKSVYFRDPDGNLIEVGNYIH